MLDAVIVGGGPAALAAALYLARAGKQVEVFERAEIGGELNRIDKIKNYPGFDGVGGELAKTMRKQAESAGAKVAYGECSKVVRGEDGAFVLTIDGEKVMARSILAATGSEPRQLDLTIQKPVSYCALCDGPLAKEKNVVVVGGANSAFQSALYLAQLAKKVTIVSHSRVKADLCLREQVKQLDNVVVQEKLEPTEELLNQFDQVFVCIGTKPATRWLRGLRTEKIIDKHIALADLEVTKEYELFDNKGSIITGGKRCTAHATQVSGLYAAGDVRAGATKQVITAAGDGAEAATEMIEWLNHA